VLARRVYEPFVAAWHRRDVPDWLTANGFTVVDDRTDFPVRTLVCERVAS
jgi:hypothetical protein